MPALWHPTLWQRRPFMPFSSLRRYVLSTGTQALMMKRLSIVSMSSSEHRELRLYAAVLSLGIAAAALCCVPLVAQISTGPQNASCLEAKQALLASLGNADNDDIVAGVLPSLTNFFIEAETQTLTGRLTCADPRPAFYNCGHTKQSVWGCKPDCFSEPDGARYVLRTPGRSYSVTGDPNQIRSFLTDEVTVTGKLNRETIKAVSVAKTSKKVRLSGRRAD